MSAPSGPRRLRKQARALRGLPVTPRDVTALPESLQGLLDHLPQASADVRSPAQSVSGSNPPIKATAPPLMDRHSTPLPPKVRPTAPMQDEPEITAVIPIRKEVVSNGRSFHRELEDFASRLLGSRSADAETSRAIAFQIALQRQDQLGARDPFDTMIAEGLRGQFAKQHFEIMEYFVQPGYDRETQLVAHAALCVLGEVLANSRRIGGDDYEKLAEAIRNNTTVPDKTVTVAVSRAAADACDELAATFAASPHIASDFVQSFPYGIWSPGRS